MIYILEISGIENEKQVIMQSTKNNSKLDNLIEKVLGKPGKVQELPEESIEEVFQYIGEGIERNKKSIICTIVILVALSIVSHLI